MVKKDKMVDDMEAVPTEDLDAADEDVWDVDIESDADKEIKKLQYRALISFIICIGYIVFGVFVYTSCFDGEEMSFVDALYFTIVTLTTVGYGDICPASDSSKIFTILFSFIGVVQIAFAFEIMAEYLLAVKQQISSDKAAEKEARIADFREGEADDQGMHRGEASKAVKKLLVPFLWLQTCVMGVTCIQLIGEEGEWTLIDGVYFAIITSTSIGYGDISPSGEWGRAMACAYIPLCVVIFASSLGAIGEVYFKLMALNADSAALDSLDVTLSELSKWDEDGDGKVDEYEFTKFMLLAMEKVDTDMLGSIEGEFKKLDADGSGYLDEADILKNAPTSFTEDPPEDDEDDALDPHGQYERAEHMAAAQRAEPMLIGDTKAADLILPFIGAISTTVMAFILAAMNDKEAGK